MIRDEIQCVLLLFTEINTLIPHSTNCILDEERNKFTEGNKIMQHHSMHIFSSTSTLLMIRLNSLRHIIYKEPSWGLKE